MFTFSSYPSVSFWEVTKHMLFPNSGNSPLQEEQLKIPSGTKAEEEQRRNMDRDASLVHDVT